jgi:hypothetical protein
MVRNPAVLLLLVLALPLPAASAAAPAEPLWLAGVAAAARAKAWSPGEMRILIDLADDGGRTLDTWDNRYRVSAGPDGVLRTEVVSASRNGKDETRKEREAQAKRDGEAASDDGSSWSRFLDDPLDPAVQESVVIRRLADARTIGGAACVAFAFTLAKQKGASVEGTAWLDAATGIPVEVVSTPRPLPRGAHEMTTTVRYAGGLPAEVFIEGSGSLLFFKRRFSSAITLGAWFARPAH